MDESKSRRVLTNNQFQAPSGLCAAFMVVSWHLGAPLVRCAVPLKCNKIKCRGFSVSAWIPWLQERQVSVAPPLPERRSARRPVNGVKYAKKEAKAS